jgi:NAD(P)-dependent dehydrogenase (short-subunit alcohol dehydrogenase family)
MADATIRVALLSGRDDEIARAIAIALAKCGFNLALNVPHEPAASVALAASVREQGTDIEYIAGNSELSDGRARIVADAQKRFGRLDVLVNIASIGDGARDILESTEQSFGAVMRSNIKGPFFLTQLVAHQMVEQHEADANFMGIIINVSSTTGEDAGNRGDYALVRPGIAMASQLWAYRLAAHNIAVYEVRTGIIQSEMAPASAKHFERLVAAGATVENRWGRSEEVGNAVAMLALGDLSYATGNVLHIDGGLSLRRL